MNTVQEIEIVNGVPDARAKGRTAFEAESDTDKKERPANSAKRDEKKRRALFLRKWLWRLSVLCVLAVSVGFLIHHANRPPEVALVTPKQARVMEAIASSGRVGSRTETFVGAQATGIVEKVFVREGDRVVAGQQLAVLKNDVARAQVAQNQASLERARAELIETSRSPLNSDVTAASEDVRQAVAQVSQQRAVVTQLEQAASRARAQLEQRRAERELAEKQFARNRTLAAQGVVAQVELV